MSCLLAVGDWKKTLLPRPMLPPPEVMVLLRVVLSPIRVLL